MKGFLKEFMVNYLKNYRGSSAVVFGEITEINLNDSMKKLSNLFPKQFVDNSGFPKIKQKKNSRRKL